MIIHGNRILTNAHAVDYAASIEVKRPGIQKQFLAHVDQIDHGCDLALLTVEDEDFFTQVTPLSVGPLASIGSVVSAYGYPIGGETVSATSGVVSRIERTEYVHSERSLLLSQIDAAINAGNSGGPVVSNSKIVGIAVQGIDEADNVAYMIPAPMIERFLKDAADGIIAGVPSFGAYCHPVENDALREYLGLSDRQSGTLVSEINYGSSSWGKLAPDDVILAVDGIPVANDRTVALTDGARVEFGYLIERKQVGESATVAVWRNKTETSVTLTLVASDGLIPAPTYETRRPYRTIGGLVFQPATADHISALTSDVPTSVLSAYLESTYRTESRRVLVMMTDILPHRVNRGYQDWPMSVVETIQGTPVEDFEHFNQLLDTATGKWLNITFSDKSRLVLDLVAARDANDEVFKTFAIAQDRWPATPATVAVK